MSVNQNYYGTYENYNNPFTPKDPFINRDARHLTKLSMLAGAGVLSFILVQYIFSFVVIGISSQGEPSFLLNALLTILLSIFGIYVPFTVIMRFYSPEDKAVCMCLDAPVSKKSFLYALVTGTAAVFAGNYITSGFSGFVSTYDIEFSNYPTENPANFLEYLLFAFEVAIIPAIVEEVAIRGIVMPPLRKYGDRFAIIMSAIIFAIMHSNMLQIPFAFVAGIVLGYFAISTKSLWTSIAIHAANNLLSVISTAALENPVISVILSGMIVALLAAGIYCGFKFIKEPHYSLGITFAPKSERKFLFASAAVFLFISFVYSLYEGDNSTPYILTSLLFAFCVRRYLKANNRQLNRLPSSSLNLKTKVALYCSTPTVVGGMVILILSAMQTVTVTSFGGYLFLYGALAAVLGATLYMIYKILHSKELESKSLYRKSLYVIIAVTVILLITSFVSNLLMF
ncbi:MAG: CPBP family intramembrane metalloprotease [Clostridia bacterium]|nr:CPBP family intramembrane metalloprotease [Clostridia bacterium]